MKSLMFALFTATMLLFTLEVSKNPVDMTFRRNLDSKLNFLQESVIENFI